MKETVVKPTWTSDAPACVGYDQDNLTEVGVISETVTSLGGWGKAERIDLQWNQFVMKSI